MYALMSLSCFGNNENSGRQSLLHSKGKNVAMFATFFNLELSNLYGATARPHIYQSGSKEALNHIHLLHFDEHNACNIWPDF